MQIAIIGTGNVGGNLGIRLSAWGHDLRFGVRRGKDVSQLLSRCGGGARALPIEEACRDADPIFLTVPAAAAVDAVRAAGDISGQTVVDCANPVAFRDGPIWSPPPEGSITAALAQHFPGVRFVKGFSTFGAEFHLDPTLDGTGIDVQLAGDDPAAKEMVAGLAQAAGFTPIDAGPLRNAALLEALAVLWIHLAVVGGQGRQVGFKLLRRI